MTLQVHIHWRAGDGEIWGWETGTPTLRPPLITTTIDVPDGHHVTPDPKIHKMDIGTHDLIDKTPEEKALANMPTLMDVQQAVAAQLAATDQYMVPDRGLPEETLAGWVAYRKALRDLSKGNHTVSDMITNFPVSPNNFDAAVSLRARLQPVTQ